MANRRPKLNPYASSMATTPQNFYKTELSNALRENAFGIKGYQLTPPSISASDSVLAHAQAIARVELLEGLAVFLRLTYVGYEIVADPDSQETQSPQMEISESLEELLRALSPAYDTKYSERLMQKLMFIK
ncbi:14852_t:CDS:2 [Acaulospora colombiana]|uniref:14852_t:CDS:1 n=1 Tax=Acaulospora colombiana TaxID=27376 RepID=A0ACA9MPM9_9GLOM|nr:14852_t:CDS:2 [Acaulospora colombiana]